MAIRTKLIKTDKVISINHFSSFTCNALVFFTYLKFLIVNLLIIMKTTNTIHLMIRTFAFRMLHLIFEAISLWSIVKILFYVDYLYFTKLVLFK